ncbi:hypothetical protein [Ravibacter arvi]|uniref:hypothetical protein n=1 Tax=Ravibacter arvi TaxID=2051041 RepID=UPI0031EF3975
MVAHLPEGHPERNAVESKDLPVVRRILFKGLGAGGEDPSTAVGMTLRSERLHP